ncbi:hypothetical protein ACKC9G_15150 [Pokkaliibacter sp. CJK22405]|uniref:hypothetical protein n=1 Tax=Pokkaliibacter sp. CJK22405 TaxID=3384615 RepID=UPI0039848C79
MTFRSNALTQHSVLGANLVREMARLDVRSDQPDSSGNAPASMAQLKDQLSSVHIDLGEKLHGLKALIQGGQRLNARQHAQCLELLEAMAQQPGAGHEQRHAVLDMLSQLHRRHPVANSDPLATEIAGQRQKIVGQLMKSPLLASPLDVIALITEPGLLDSKSLRALSLSHQGLLTGFSPPAGQEVALHRQLFEALDKSLPFIDQQDRQGLRQHLQSLSPASQEIARPRDEQQIPIGERSLQSLGMVRLLESRATPENTDWLMRTLMPVVEALPAEQHPEVLAAMAHTMDKHNRPLYLDSVDRLTQQLELPLQVAVKAHYPSFQVRPDHDPYRAADMSHQQVRTQAERQAVIVWQNFHTRPEFQAEDCQALLSFLGKHGCTDWAQVIGTTLDRMEDMSEPDQARLLPQLMALSHGHRPPRQHHQLMEGCQELLQGMDTHLQFPAQQRLLPLMRIEDQVSTLREMNLLLSITSDVHERQQGIRQFSDTLQAMYRNGSDSNQNRNMMDKLLVLASKLPENLQTPALLTSLLENQRPWGQYQSMPYARMLGVVGNAARLCQNDNQFRDLAQVLPPFEASMPGDHGRLEAQRELFGFIGQLPGYARVHFLPPTLTQLGYLEDAESVIRNTQDLLHTLREIPEAGLQSTASRQSLAGFFSDAAELISHHEALSKRQKRELTQELKAEESRLVPADLRHRSTFRAQVYDFFAKGASS